MTIERMQQYQNIVQGLWIPIAVFILLGVYSLPPMSAVYLVLTFVAAIVRVVLWERVIWTAHRQGLTFTLDGRLEKA